MKYFKRVWKPWTSFWLNVKSWGCFSSNSKHTLRSENENLELKRWAWCRNGSSGRVNDLSEVLYLVGVTPEWNPGSSETYSVILQLMLDQFFLFHSYLSILNGVSSLFPCCANMKITFSANMERIKASARDDIYKEIREVCRLVGAIKYFQRMKGCSVDIEQYKNRTKKQIQFIPLPFK